MMKRNLGRFHIRYIVALLLFTVVLTGFWKAGSAAPPLYQYVGVEKCQFCHSNRMMGNQYGIWKRSAHASAYKTLTNEQAQVILKKMGIEGSPWERSECLKCHVTAFNALSSVKSKGYSLESGVTCEACHGPGSGYAKMKIMKDRGAALAAGLIILPKKETCTSCHNAESLTYKAFDYQLALKKIIHPLKKTRWKK